MFVSAYVYGVPQRLPIGEDDRLVGMVTDRDIVCRCIADGLDPTTATAQLTSTTHDYTVPIVAGAGAVDYLRLMGIVVVGWMWARMAQLAQQRLASNPPNADFYKSKLTAGRYWMERMIPECPMLSERIQAGCETIMAFDETIN